MSSSANVLPAGQPVHAIRASFAPLILFCVAHFFIDLYQGALGVMQPLLIGRFGLTLTEAGFLGGTLVFSSSLLQPVYGYLSDRFHTRMFTVLAPATAALFIASLGLAPGYRTLLMMVLLGGTGVASFHPQATANATAGLDMNRGRAMAIFISSGTLGLALGPTYFSYWTEQAGLERTWIAAAPGVLVTLLLAAFLRFPTSAVRRKETFDLAALRAEGRQLSILFWLVFLRSVVQVTFAQLLPIYLHLQRGYSLQSAAYITSGYLVGGALGGFVGGNLSDRVGGRRVILVSMLGSVPFLVLFVQTTGPLSVAGLILGGSILLFTIPVNVLMGQQLVPSQASTVSALMMGFAWGAAGLIFIPLTGWVADHYSLQHAFSGLVLFPLIGFALALKLRK